MFLVHTAMSSHTSYTKADCCCFSELVSRRRRQVRLVCGGCSEILLTGATRGHWKERTGQKMQSWEAAGQDTARALLPAHSKNKLKSNRTCSSFLYKSNTDRCPRLEVEGCQGSQERANGTQRMCWGIRSNRRESTKQSWELHKCAQLTT